jgi:GT2 family glycosyltransferase
MARDRQPPALLRAGTAHAKTRRDDAQGREKASDDRAAPHMSTSSPKISVLMPVYDSARFLPAAVDSILRQTLVEIELFALDGGSSDGSIEMLRRMAADDPRLKVIAPGRLGLVESLNLGVSLAQAPLIARMDADDVARPDRFAKQLALLADQPDVVAVSGGIDFIDEDGRYLKTLLFPTLPESIASELFFHSVVVHPAVMMRTASVRAVGGYRRVARHAEDYDLWLRLNETGRIANLPDVVLSFRTHPANTSKARFIEKELAVVAARAAARQRRAGKADPLAALEQRTPDAALSYALLRAALRGGRFAEDVAFPFFRETLGQAGALHALGRWLGLYARYGLWDLHAEGAKEILLAGAHLMLRQRRAGARGSALMPYLGLLAMTACRHPVVALGVARDVGYGRLALRRRGSAKTAAPA